MELSNQEIAAISDEIHEIEEMVAELEEGARLDMQPKVVRLKIMESALKRDFVEMNMATGADRETAEHLYSQLEKEADSLKDEMDALSQGNPTTVSAAADAVFRVLDNLSGKISAKKKEIKEAYREGFESSSKK